MHLVVGPRPGSEVGSTGAKPVGEELAEREPADVEPAVAEPGEGQLAVAGRLALGGEAALARGPAGASPQRVPALVP
jgi:hypothetical protein